MLGWQKSASVCNRLCASVAAGLYFLMLRIPGEMTLISLLVTASVITCHVTLTSQLFVA